MFFLLILRVIYNPHLVYHRKNNVLFLSLYASPVSDLPSFFPLPLFFCSELTKYFSSLRALSQTRRDKSQRCRWTIAESLDMQLSCTISTADRNYLLVFIKYSIRMFMQTSEDDVLLKMLLY